MTKTTKITLQQQVTDLLKGADSDVINQFFWSEYSDERSDYDKDSIGEFQDQMEIEGITVKHVDNFGGEGEGEDYWSVYEFTRDNEEVLIKFQGWYQSYNGGEFTEFFVCKPVPKTGFDYVSLK